MYSIIFSFIMDTLQLLESKIFELNHDELIILLERITIALKNYSQKEIPTQRFRKPPQEMKGTIIFHGDIINTIPEEHWNLSK